MNREMIVAGIIVIGSLGLLAIVYHYRAAEGEAIAKAEGCEYLGRPRDVDVAVLNCNGQIVHKPLGASKK